jgi:hypothetical protein
MELVGLSLAIIAQCGLLRLSKKGRDEGGGRALNGSLAIQGLRGMNVREKRSGNGQTKMAEWAGGQRQSGNYLAKRSGKNP